MITYKRRKQEQKTNGYQKASTHSNAHKRKKSEHEKERGHIYEVTIVKVGMLVNSFSHFPGYIYRTAFVVHEWVT